MTRFYTQTGDDGYTGLLGKGRAAKYDPLVETIGCIDEANASIGFARSMSRVSQTPSILLGVQRDLYHIMTEIAVLAENSTQFSKFSGERVDWLESKIDEISNVIAIPKDFIIPGDTQAGAVIDLARTSIRKAERQIAQVFHAGLISNNEILRYMNRLSSLCFALELLENQAGGYSKPTLAKE